MTSETIDPMEKLLGDIHDLHIAAWSQAAPQTREQVYEQTMLGAMRSLSQEMLRLGVTSVIMEGAYLFWWLRIACVNHGFAKGGFDSSLKRIGPLTGV
jgi:hypothetical protein